MKREVYIFDSISITKSNFYGVILDGNILDGVQNKRDHADGPHVGRSRDRFAADHLRRC